MRAMPEHSTRPLVAIIMGSKSDWGTMSHDHTRVEQPFGAGDVVEGRVL
jgi:phosphoribosylcarboxyaminoimidazole (NCAIR) mutase